jgi:hypothetical protein
MLNMKTPDKKIHIHFPEMESWVKEVTPAREQAGLVNKDYPMVLMAGNHMEMVANTILRDPAWNQGKHPCPGKTPGASGSRAALPLSSMSN